MISAWTQAHVRAIAPSPAVEAPVITAADLHAVLPGFQVWDMWPLALADGMNASVAGGVLWFALAAPAQPDPVDRHGLARIRLLHQVGTAWRDCGHALPEGACPGSREWSGSALFDPAANAVLLWFTAAGQAGETSLSYRQRLFQIRGMLRTGGVPSIVWFGAPHESVASDGVSYDPADQQDGAPGTIKAFRDPGYFRDPRDGASYLVFAASLKQSPHPANGAVGLARARDATLEAWSLLPPLLHADGVNNELERPHVVWRAGLYYLFWSTQRHTFAAGGASGPNGLYGMVAPAMEGPYAPLNGSGLVIANPEAEPGQAYSWWVSADGSVTSFVDYWGMAGRRLATHPELRLSRFGGVPAPFLHLTLNGDRTVLRRG